MAAVTHDRYDDAYLRKILRDTKTIAMVGLSANWNRPSYFAAKYLLDRLRALRAGVSRAAIVSAGEITVKVEGAAGAGGRNQHFALWCARQIAGEQITVMSAGTDGIDGNSPAAGAIADGTTLLRAQQAGLDPAAALSTFNSFPLFERLGDAIVTGATGNNVRDLRILLAY